MPYPISKEAMSKRTEANHNYKLQWLSALKLKDDSSNGNNYLESIDNDLICHVEQLANAVQQSGCGIEKRPAML